MSECVIVWSSKFRCPRGDSTAHLLQALVIQGTFTLLCEYSTNALLLKLENGFKLIWCDSIVYRR